MPKTNSNQIIAGPWPFYMALLAIGTVFCFWLAYLSAGTFNLAQIQSISLPQKICVGFFVLLGLACVFSFVTAKRIIITSSEVIVERPFLLMSKTHNRTDIATREIKKADIATINKVNREMVWYNGENLVIKFKDNSSLRIGSLEVSNFDKLKKNI